MIEPADLDWRDGQPYSRAFGDIYHARDGRDEVARVFLEPAGFDGLLHPGNVLRVGELGFGTGLNFAVTARRCLAAGVRLQFVSFEAAPLAHADMARVVRDRASAEPVYRDLLSGYPPLLPGWHQRRLCGGRIVLSLYFGTARAGLADIAGQSHQPFDLWLLDGFAPDRNPGLWEDALLQQVGLTASRGTRVTTFTSAGRVRRGLIAAGFEMRRVDQRPHKRESLAGVFTGEGLSRQPPRAQVTIIGAGIAGAAVARSLATAGTHVRVLERAVEPAAGASSIPATVMHPRLHHDGSAAAALKATAYAHALAAVAPFVDQPGSGVRRTGALQIPSANYPPERLAAVARRYAETGLGVQLVSAADAAALARSPSLRLPGPVLWFPDACLVDTPALTRTLLEHPDIELLTGQGLTTWPEGPAVLACGMAARGFEGAAFLELGSVFGQLDVLRPVADALRSLAVPIVGNGYVTPMPGAGGALVAAGATYEYEPWTELEATRRNLEHVERLVSNGAHAERTYRAERTVSSDRNPVIGPIYDRTGDASVDRFVSLGHGSMGTVTAHLGADLLAARIGGDFQPLLPAQRDLITPLRFRQRQKRRGYRFGAAP